MILVDISQNARPALCDTGYMQIDPDIGTSGICEWITRSTSGSTYHLGIFIFHTAHAREDTPVFILHHMNGGYPLLLYIKRIYLIFLLFSQVQIDIFLYRKFYAIATLS